MRWTPIALAFILLPNGGHAEVLSASPQGFSLRIETVMRAGVEQSWQAFAAIDRWWDPAHSYSGEAGNLSLALAPGGAFLERLEHGGFVEHLGVVYFEPGREIRFLGGLGPLQPMGVFGAMTIQFEAGESGSRTVTRYNVTGYSGDGLEALAPIVDRVLADQLRRHATYADAMAAGKRGADR